MLSMSFDAPEATAVPASESFFCLIGARYNEELVDCLMDNARRSLEDAGVPEANIASMRVPGANELPYAAYMQAMSGQYDAVIAMGVVIAGETSHHELIARSTASAFQDIGMRTEVPVINGVLTTDTIGQAEARCGAPYNRGKEFAQAAIEMAAHRIALVARLDEIEAQYHQRTAAVSDGQQASQQEQGPQA
jgi:6,7-dimethyl-8-ribityllumazine synthase